MEMVAFILALYRKPLALALAAMLIVIFVAEHPWIAAAIAASFLALLGVLTLLLAGRGR